METLHKLAGVQDASDLQSSSAERPSQASIVPDTARESNDIDAQDGGQLAQRASRASLPLNRKPSHKSFRNSKYHKSDENIDAPQDDPPPLPSTRAAYISPTAPEPQPQQLDGAESAPHRRSRDTTASVATESEDFAWGPSHPCFPHPNPHCSPSSQEYRSTRVIRVKRDWLAAGDLYPQYANLYPEILDPLVTDSEFRYLISNLNSRLKAAFDPFGRRAWVDAFLGLVTGWIWDDLGATGAKRAEKGIEALIDRWNSERAHEGKEVRVIQLRRTGFMSLDFVIPDPGIDGAGGDGE